MVTTGPTEVYALRYAARPECRTSEAFYRYDLYGEPDVAIGMDYFFWVIRGGGRTVVVDCGFSEDTARSRGRVVDTHPAVLLSRMGVDPADVDDVVLSHLHFDHVGNTDLFPSARFHLAGAELDHWGGRHRDRLAFSWPVEPSEVRAVEELRREERVHLVDRTTELLPGVRLVPAPGHTPGQLTVHARTEDGHTVVLASDAMHYYDEVRRHRPFYIWTDLGALYDTYDELRVLDARPDVDVVAGHDPEVRSRYAEVERDCFDLLARQG